MEDMASAMISQHPAADHETFCFLRNPLVDDRVALSSLSLGQLSDLSPLVGPSFSSDEIAVTPSAKVQFSVQLTAVIPIAVFEEGDMDAGERWYQQDELAVFRTQARDMCRHMRSFTHVSLCTMSWDSDENKCDTRGLEQRTCLERQRRKYVSNRWILRAAQQLPAERLADLSSKVTAWAVDLAAQEGARDFERAYSVNAVADNLKRECPSRDHDCRQVRHRTV